MREIGAQDVDPPRLRGVEGHAEPGTLQKPAVGGRQRQGKACFIEMAQIDQTRLPLFSCASSTACRSAPSAGSCLCRSVRLVRCHEILARRRRTRTSGYGLTGHGRFRLRVSARFRLPGGALSPPPQRCQPCRALIRAASDCGTVSPSAFAVLRLMTLRIARAAPGLFQILDGGEFADLLTHVGADLGRNSVMYAVQDTSQRDLLHKLVGIGPTACLTGCGRADCCQLGRFLPR